MSGLTVGDVYAWVDSIAPFATQADFDNSGLLTGHPDREVTGILVCLDVTPPVLREAAGLGANLILSHHPLMFRPIQRLTETDYEGRLLCRMIREGVAMIAAHTSWDQAPGGINDTLAARCGLSGVTGEGYLRLGDLPEGMTAGRLIRRLEECLHATVRVMSRVGEDRLCRRMAVSGGAGSEFFQEALEGGADVFLTGEMKHHHALAAAEAGMLTLEAGHFATEEPGIFALADRLQRHLKESGCGIQVYQTQTGAYAPSV